MSTSGSTCSPRPSRVASPAERLADLELAYAPPFSSAKDPVNMLGYMAENVRSGACDLVAYDELGPLIASGWTLLDVRTDEEHANGVDSRGAQHPGRRAAEELGPVPDAWSSTARWATAATPRRRSPTSSASRPGTSTAGTARGWRPTLPPPGNRVG